jgi:Zn-dependent peptidase ImmA (M78 family)
MRALERVKAGAGAKAEALATRAARMIILDCDMLKRKPSEQDRDKKCKAVIDAQHGSSARSKVIQSPIKRRFFYLYRIFIADKRRAWDASPTYRSHCELKYASRTRRTFRGKWDKEDFSE